MKPAASRVSDRQGGRFQLNSRTLFQDLLSSGAKIIWELEELRDPFLDLLHCRSSHTVLPRTEDAQSAHRGEEAT